MRPKRFSLWKNAGSPGSRARCFGACSGSATARNSETLRDSGAHLMVPSVYPKSVGVPECVSFAAQYPARTFPCQRFDVVLANNSA
jgi:hypothetical protein